jgi:hypothetical protein
VKSNGVASLYLAPSPLVGEGWGEGRGEKGWKGSREGEAEMKQEELRKPQK